MEFERVLELPRAVYQHGVGDEMRRLTLFDQIKRKPNSQQSRWLVTNSSRYGLTTGSYKAEKILLTPQGKSIVSGDVKSNSATLRLAFECAIERTNVFNGVYEKLVNNRIPSNSVLRDTVGQAGIDEGDCDEAARIFLANARYLGLIKNMNGVDYLIPIDQAVEEMSVADTTESSVDPASETVDSEADDGDPPMSSDARPASRAPGLPSLHIDVQIHIDSQATPDQINQVFESMARHLYGREG